MRRSLLLTVLFIAVPQLSHAQNYIPPQDYSGAGVIVNLDVLSTRQAPMQLTPPVHQAPQRVMLRPPVQTAPKLTAPAPMAAAPRVASMPTPMPVPRANALPPVMPAPIAPAPVASAAVAPKAVVAAPVASAPVINHNLGNAPMPLASISAPRAGGEASVSPTTVPATAHVAPGPKSIESYLIDDPVGVTSPINKTPVISAPIAPAMPMPIAKAPAPIAPAAPVAKKAVEEIELRDYSSASPVVTQNKPESSSRKLLAKAKDEAAEPMAAPSSATPILDELIPLTSNSKAMPAPITQDIAALPEAPEEIVAKKPVLKNDVPSSSDAFRVLFDKKSEKINSGEEATLNKAVALLQADSSSRLVVRAYADGTPETTSAARRLSLMRALNVRDYITKKNISATRLDIRALGNGSVEMGDQVGRGSAPADRVDIAIVK
jgi:outer membrane protein OmpA-like peptidoglycan-associated protein